MSDIEKRCTNCEHGSIGGLVCHTDHGECIGFSFWRESELSKCQRKLEIAMKHLIDEASRPHWTANNAEMTLKKIEEIDND